MDLKLRQEFARAALKTFDLTMLDGIQEDDALESLVTELNDQINDLNDPKTMEKRNTFFGIDETEANHYQETVFDIQNLGKVLAGIRHAGGNVDKPFVNIWPSFEITSLNELKIIFDSLERSFKIFNPKHISLWLNPSSALCSSLEKELSPNLRYIVASVKEIKKKEKPEKYSEIGLQKIDNNSYRPWYEELYQNFHKEFPELKDWVPVNDAEEMSESISSGLMYYAKIADEKVGLISGTKESILGRPGLYFSEIVIDKKLKGKGYGPAIQRKFIDELLDDNEIVWGTIDARNIPSTKTAQRVGRRPIRNEFFLPIEMLK